MKTWQLECPFTEADAEWLTLSGLDVIVDSPFRLSDFDSGWCDAATGNEILTDYHKIFINTTTDEEETWLKLRYDDRVYLLSTVLSINKNAI
jgi:hypothetical protein